jgi:hypothetical protein
MPDGLGALRPATRADNVALLELFGSVPMTGELVLSTRRDPDFFALYDMQRGEAECWVYETGGEPAGLGAILVRDGWVGGRAARVGYLGDLRSQPRASRERGVLRVYGGAIDAAIEKHGCELFYTAVLASNTAAINALVRRRKARESQPYYHLLRRFSMTSVQFATPVRPRPGRFHVRTATAVDVPEIVALLDRDHRGRPFGYRYDQGEFEHRLERWPGMSLDRTYLAHDAEGGLVGVTTAWDPAAVKRYRVVAYRGSMRWMKLGFNAAARVFGWPRLPEPGHDFRYLYLCNTSIDGERPEVLRAMLERIYTDFHRSGYHFFSLCVYDGDPLAPALRGFLTRRLGFHLYVVTRGAEAPSFPEGRPGFEMALA